MLLLLLLREAAGTRRDRGAPVVANSNSVANSRNI
jgi:hypothetical protein